ncbi:MinD/ParA family protein [Microbacterium sp. KUDC0406]|uniref:MinD/ParA family ATP-binding protein n=1 Tax=Microbacterium sp. KUDC0406 TaxID=2909588 RepID=UPI001F3B8C72|nr:MinD/ParA family protein [Microbacterium sp. KUDC0406]UJP10736.1 MinD/ParA family protein [Microbacterium sp. KUDC0406]
MTPKKTDDQDGDEDRGVLDDSASLDDAGIGFLGATAQVNVAMPTGGDDEDLDADDDVLGDEIAVEPPATDLVIDRSAVADDETVERLQRDTTEIIIELPAGTEPPVIADLVESDAGAAPDLVVDEPDAVTAEVVLEDVAPSDEGDGADGDTGDDHEDPDAGDETPDDESLHDDARDFDGEELDAEDLDDDLGDDSAGEDLDDGVAETATGIRLELMIHGEPDGAVESAEQRPTEKRPVEPESVDGAVAAEHDITEEQPAEEPAPAAAAVEDETLDAETVDGQDREDEAVAGASVPAAATGMLTAPEEETTVDTDDQRELAPRPAAGAPRTRAEAHRTAEVALSSKRLGDASREASRESADLLTAERLLDPSRMVKPEPEGAWNHLVYTVSGRRINLGDGKKARARKELTGRISGHLQGNARFVPVLSRKGGVGKTTVTALLGMALADARDDRVIAVDANPDRGTLADRIVGESSRSVRDLVRAKDEVQGFHDVSALVARDSTRLDVLASDSDPRVAEAFSDSDYRDVASVAAHYYSLVLTDTGTGIVHDVMGATLDLADQIVIVSGLSVDEARLASETLTWLETNGYADKARDAIVVLNQSTSGAPLVRLNELQAHFSTRVGHVIRIPYDPQIAGGGAIVWSSLAPETRLAARELAAQLVEGLRTQVTAR